MHFVIHEYTEVTVSSKGQHIHRTANIGMDPSQVLSSSFMTSLEWNAHHFATNASLPIESSCIVRDIIQSICKPLLDHELQHVVDAIITWSGMIPNYTEPSPNSRIRVEV